jgi:hypothetical protein
MWADLGILLAIALGLVALVVLGMLLFSREYDRHPSVRRWSAEQAKLHGVIPPDEDLTDEYLSQIPGGWDKP